MNVSKLIVLFTLVLSAHVTFGQEQAAENQSLLVILENQINQGIEDSIFLANPLVVIQGVPIQYEKRKEALANLTEEDLISIQSVSYKKISQISHNARNGAVLITLKEKSSKRWFRYAKKLD